MENRICPFLYDFFNNVNRKTMPFSSRKVNAWGNHFPASLTVDVYPPGYMRYFHLKNKRITYALLYYTYSKKSINTTFPFLRQSIIYVERVSRKCETLQNHGSKITENRNDGKFQHVPNIKTLATPVMQYILFFH